MEAQFIGKNLSMGFLTGFRYHIRIEFDMYKGKRAWVVYAQQRKTTVVVPYSSMEKLEENWRLPISR